MDLVTWAAAAVAAATLMRLVIWPFLRASWLAIKAAPQIPIILDDVREILRGDVLGKLDDMRTTFTLHEEQAQRRDVNIASHEERLNLHTRTLEQHEVRLSRLEAGSDDE